MGTCSPHRGLFGAGALRWSADLVQTDRPLAARTRRNKLSRTRAPILSPLQRRLVSDLLQRLEL